MFGSVPILLGGHQYIYYYYY